MRPSRPEPRRSDAERRAADIRIRAELKAGELLRETEKAKGGGDSRKPKEHRSQRATSAKTLKQLGVSETQSLHRSRAQGRYNLLRWISKG